MRQLYRKFFEKDLKTQLIIVFLLFLLLGLGLDLTPSSEPHPLESKEVKMATMIPEGMVLQPLHLKNAESLDLVLDQYGVVSLFEPDKDHQFVRNLKVFRAPKDPSIFLALVPIKHSTEFVKKNKNLTAVVLKQDGANSGTVFDYQRVKKSRPLLIGNTKR